MPELPEVEVLARFLRPLLINKVIRAITVQRDKVLRPTPVVHFKRVLRDTRFTEVARRGKYLLFTLRPRGQGNPLTLVGHLGMTGRLYLMPAASPLPKHAAVVFNLGRHKLVFEDTRYFGRVTLDTSPINHLGPEPLSTDFSVAYFVQTLKRYRQDIKVKLLDQTVVAGIGNIYASEALFRARLSPHTPAHTLTPSQVKRLWQSVRSVLTEAITWGSTVPLNWSGVGERNRLFYYGAAPGAAAFYQERLCVYDRQGQPCRACGTLIERCIQAARSTFYCPKCQS